MARTIGRRNRALVRGLVLEELRACERRDPFDPDYSRVEESVVGRLPEELWDTWEGADGEIRMLIHDTIIAGGRG